MLDFTSLSMHGESISLYLTFGAHYMVVYSLARVRFASSVLKSSVVAPWSDFMLTHTRTYLFHSPVRHFLTCCRRMLGLSFETKAGGSICIPFNGRNVTITCSHAGIETSHLIDILRSDDAAASLRSMWDLELNHQRADTSAVVEPSGEEKDTPKTCQLIASADHAEGLRGITLKLLAFDRFLEERPHWRGRVRLLQIGIALDSRPDDARRVRKDVTELVEAINKRYEEDYPDPKWPAVTYRAVKSFPIHERLALWRISSIMLSTCVRSGLDLHPLEYVFCRGSVSGVNAGDGDDESSPFAAEPIDSPGVVVLSGPPACRLH